LDPSKIKDAAEHKPDSAIRVLIDEDNRQLEIYPGGNRGKGYYLFEDLVEQHCNTLEQIMDHHRHVAGQNGVNLKVRVRKQLEGWDFVELATHRDPYPHVATIEALGYGWIDLIRSIGAITLFGRGFSDIIRPIEFDGMCPHWKSLPTQKYYLAASVFDLKNIMQKLGDERADPLRLVHDLNWHCPGDLVAPCQCQLPGADQMISGEFKGQSRHHDPVQVLFPRRLRFVVPIRGPGRLEDGGAVVFGRNSQWKYHWRENEHEDLEEGESPPSLQAPTSFSSGSLNQGAGLSIASGSTQKLDSIKEP
jgi:hypothetical protein